MGADIYLDGQFWGWCSGPGSCQLNPNMPSIRGWPRFDPLPGTSKRWPEHHQGIVFRSGVVQQEAGAAERKTPTTVIDTGL
jgi:hypothetical protein